ncbi:MAG: arsenite efflux transporter metallochaperone ArsD [Bacteriovoracaceae bacterium]|jgi:hypothetical protein|nr:arsenite efflux transporter metallochaperone ArsD [Bacteriovoracaceae bacterium]
MKSLKIYDGAMCCSTGVCGTDVDAELVEFANAVKLAAEKGVDVKRYNLAQEPSAFVENEQVKNLLAEKSSNALPFIFIDDELKLSEIYPTTAQLAKLLGIELSAKSSCCGETKDKSEDKESCCDDTEGCC